MQDSGIEMQPPGNTPLLPRKQININNRCALIIPTCCFLVGAPTAIGLWLLGLSYMDNAKNFEKSPFPDYDDCVFVQYSGTVVKFFLDICRALRANELDQSLSNSTAPNVITVQSCFEQINSACDGFDDPNGTRTLLWILASAVSLATLGGVICSVYFLLRNSSKKEPIDSEEARGLVYS